MATLLGRGIPAISSITGTAAWAMRIASNLASSFGWAKPTYLDANMRMMVTTNTYQHNCDGVDNTYNVGLFSDNHVVPVSGFAGTDVDEMAFSYILGQWALICNGSLSTTDTAGQIKYGVNLTPRSMWYNVVWNYPQSFANATVANPSGFFTTPCFYVSNAFQMWKGGFEFRIKIAKTKFHTGRLVLAFVPVDGQPSPTPGSGLFAPVLYPSGSPMHYESAVWDLREGNTFQFICPFISEYSYLKVGNATNDVQDYGNFIITVLDPLQAPSTVATVIPFAIEMRCLPDFEFQLPMTPLFSPSPFSQTSWVAQSILPTTTASDAQRCTGEQCRSVKQLISRACGLAGGTITGNTYHHWYTLVGTVPFVSGSTTNYPLMPFSTYFALMYAYARGSTTYDLFWGGNSGSGAFGPMPTTPIYATAVSAINYQDPGNKSCQATIPEGNQLHIRIPQAQCNSRTFVWPAVYDAQPQNALGIYGYPVGIGFPGIGFVRAGDDSQLGFYLGSPPMDLIGATSQRASELNWINDVKYLTPLQAT
jgi:hypothetical protein